MSLTPKSLQVAVLCAALVFAESGASADGIKVIASNAVKAAYIELIPEFEQESGHKVTVDWGGTADIRKRIEAGETADLVIVPSFVIDDLIAKGVVLAGSRVDLVKSSIGVAIRIGARKPDLSSREGLKKSLIAADRIVLSGGPSGDSMTRMFETWGIAGQIKAKIIRIAPGEPVAGVLASGDGDIGFTQVSEFLHAKGIDYQGPLPADSQEITIFSSGVPKTAPKNDAPAALIRFVTSPSVLSTLKRNGLEPSSSYER